MNFDKRQALYCAKAIESLYRGDIGPTIVCTQSDTQVRVEQIADRHYAIIFPGTASIQDWLTDARIKKVSWGEGKVHAGFASAFRSVADAIQDAIPSAASVLIAGHSLGGALATLCADSFQDVFNIEGIYTFGSPRVGNSRFVGEYNLGPGVRTWRIVNANDPVPHLPWVFGTYRHVDTQVYLRKDNTAQIAEPLRVAASEWLNTIEVATTEPAAALSVIVPHHIHSYVRKLEAVTA